MKTASNRARLKTGIWLWAGLVWLCLSVGAEIVFDNTFLDVDNMFYPFSQEFGDEINLGGTARTITRLQIEYFGEFNPTGAESARVRIYDNDGAGDNEYGQFEAPGTMLYESDLMPIAPGFNALTLRDISVTVSNNFTYTVKFNGLSGSYSNRAGLVFYDPPTVGFSYDDFWQKTSSGWLPYNFEGRPKSNFAIRVVATPDPLAALTLLANYTNGLPCLRITGPTYSNCVLEASTDQVHWSVLHYFFLMGDPIDFVDNQAAGSPPRFYRVRLLDQPEILAGTSQRLPSGEFRMQLFGPPGRAFVVEASRDMHNWFPNQTNFFVTAEAVFSDTNAVSFGRRFYRAAFAPDPPVQMISITPVASGLKMLLLAGPSGRDCVIESSDHMADWTPISTNTFSFTGSDIRYLDLSDPPSGRQFYRARLLP
ncbi:MAG: hypothetical protein M1608_04310 [Candidatus Omnitrophica bacterium]|nr:hypothetical protein [Candidatus Omnitrophota bacterium]